METKHTPGNWKVGKTGGAVVSDQPLPGYDINGGHDHIEYYGGHLIAESIWRKEDVRLIAAAPSLLAELGHAHQIIRNALNIMTPEQKAEWAALNERDGCVGEGTTRANERQAVIAKATGEAQS